MCEYTHILMEQEATPIINLMGSWMIPFTCLQNGVNHSMLRKMVWLCYMAACRMPVTEGPAAYEE
jgi:hypothetical protein